MKKYIKEHLAVKIFILTAVLLFAVSGFIYGMVAFGVSKSYLAELDESLDESTKNLITQLTQVSESEMETMLKMYALEYGLSITLKDKNGKDLKSFGQIEYKLDPDTDSEKSQISKGITKTYFIQRKSGPDYQILLFGTKQRANAALDSLNRILPVLIGISIFISLVIALFYSRYVTNPILKLSKVSKRLSALDFQIRCPENRSDEIGVLGENLNQLSEKLEEALGELKEKNLLLQEDILHEKEMEQQQLAFFSAVSHELKTPVTVLKGQIQGMLYGIGGYKDRDKYLKRSYEVVDSMDGMIQEILSVARIKSSGFVLNRVRVSLNKMVQGVIRNLEDIAIDKGIQIHTALLEHAEVMADEAQFEKVLSNVIGNAVKYTPDNGNIWIEIFREDGKLVISVENEADKIPEEEIPRLFDAFYRRDRSRSRKTGGSGLGLYIVKMIIELHGFGCQFHNTEHGVEIKITCT